MKTKQRLPHHRRNHESDRNSEANRRAGQGSYTQRDTEDAAYTGGRPLEIFTDREGEVILKKYSPIGELGDFAREYAESLHQSLNRTTLICDKDTVIAVSGGSKKELMERPIHEDVERCMKEREKLVINKGQCEMQGIIDGEDPEKHTAEVIVPILCAGDAIGAVVMVSREPGDIVGDTELKVCETAANFMGKQMEN